MTCMAPSQAHAMKEKDCSKPHALHSVAYVRALIPYSCVPDGALDGVPDGVPYDVRGVLDCVLDGVLCALVLPGDLGTYVCLVCGVCSASLELLVSLSALCSWKHLSESGSQPRRRWAQRLAKCTCNVIA